ncbi:MAG: polysaccharide lyase family 7 protein [Bacteroidota bacterium]
MKQILLFSTLLVLLFLAPNDCLAQKKKKKTGKKSTTEKTAPNIDLTHWKVTVPASKPDGKPIEVSPPEIFDYANDERLKEFMYNDSTDGSIVFYAYPASSTANSKYSRSELREQMVSGSNATNWTFKQGGRMKATLSVPKVTKESSGKRHRIIIAQIHGRLTNEQRDLIGQKDNNAPPVLKVYWEEGKIVVRRKILKDPKVNDIDILKKEAWVDDEKYTFYKMVERKKVTIEIIASEGRLEIVLNGREKAVYKDKHMDRWGVFENYFKVGNYFNTRDKGAYAMVKLYDLEVSH